MDEETAREIRSIHAEMLAFNAIVTQVLYRVLQTDHKLADAISLGFDDAARLVEDIAIKAGKSVPPDHLVKALRVVEELRTATLGNSAKPKHIV
jgi:hypothetical protein